MESLKESVERSLEWKLKAEQALNPSHLHPTLDSLHSLVAKAKTLPIKLDLVNNVSTINKCLMPTTINNANPPTLLISVTVL